jgi:hypothetical protein
MNEQNIDNYSYTFKTTYSPDKVFPILLDIDKWWTGLYSENIEGKSQMLNDEFSFSAGGGVHYSRQKLIELIPDKRIVWMVTDSNLTFIKDTKEWTNSKICFDITSDGAFTKITFTHDGLIPKIECYNGCSGAWTQYLERLAERLR